MEEGSGNGAPERPEAPASVVSGGGTGLCRTAGPPLRGISTRPFPCLFLTLPQPPALSLGGRLFTPPNRVHWPQGPGARPTGTCYQGSLLTR